MPGKSTEGRPVSYSRLETRHRPQPSEANTFGVMHGGYTLYHLDTFCGMTAMRHAGTRVVTVAVDRMDFKSPIHMGENLVYKTSVNRVHRSSLEVGARIEAETPETGELRHVGTAYLTFVALNENGRPTGVPPLIAENGEDRRRMADAVRRAYLRRMERDQANGKAFSFPIELLPERFLLCRAEAGFDVRINAMEFASSLQAAQRGDFEAYFIGWSGRVDPDGNIFSFVHTTGGQNDGKYSNPEIDRLLAEARAESDETKRRALYADITRILVTEDRPRLYLWSRKNLVGHTAKLSGYVDVPDGLIRLRGVKLD